MKFSTWFKMTLAVTVGILLSGVIKGGIMMAIFAIMKLMAPTNMF